MALVNALVNTRLVSIRTLADTCSVRTCSFESLEGVSTVCHLSSGTVNAADPNKNIASHGAMRMLLTFRHTEGEAQRGYG